MQAALDAIRKWSFVDGDVVVQLAAGTHTFTSGLTLPKCGGARYDIIGDIDT